MSFEQAVIHHERGEIKEAIAIYDQLLNGNFFDYRILFYYATALLQQGKSGLAANVFKQIILQDPKQQAAFQNLGNCFKYENKMKDAEDVFRLGLELGETDELWASLGGLYINNGTPHKALEYYEKGLKLNDKNDLIRFNMGLAYLELGLWELGFKNYEIGFKAGNRTGRNYHRIDPWDGSDGKTLILYGEQGLGDEIMFASCIADAVKKSKRVIFDCHPRLVETFKRSFPDVEVHGTRKNQVVDWVKTTDADAYSSITTMAMHIRNNKIKGCNKIYSFIIIKTINYFWEMLYMYLVFFI